MRILFFTKSKPFTFEILQKLCEKGHTVSVVCKTLADFADTKMGKWCREQNIPVYDNVSLYEDLKAGKLPRFELGISNTFGRLIKKPIIDHVQGKIFNVHCAPLPEYKGMFAYNWGIFNQEKEWGVTVHYVNEKFDEGDIIELVRFPVDPNTITVKALEHQSQQVGAEVTLRLVERFASGEDVAGVPQQSGGHYYSREDFETLKRVSLQESAETIAKKIQACYCPPYEGAYFERDGKRFYLHREP